MKTLLLAIKTVALMLINFIKRTTKYPHTFFKKATRDELNKNHKPKNSTPRTKPKKRNGTYRPRHRNEETHIPWKVTQKLVKLILLTATPLLTTTVALASAVALALATAPIAAVSLASATVLAAARVLDPAAHTPRTWDRPKNNYKPTLSTPRTKPKRRNSIKRIRHWKEHAFTPWVMSQKLAKLLLLTATFLRITGDLHKKETNMKPYNLIHNKIFLNQKGNNLPDQTRHHDQIQ